MLIPLPGCGIYPFFLRGMIHCSFKGKNLCAYVLTRLIGYTYSNYKGLDAPAIFHAGNRGDW